MNKTELSSAISNYRECADGTAHHDPKKANVFHRRLHEAYKQLRDTSEGRNLIAGVLKDSSPHVRCWAAAHSLEWTPETSRAVLEALGDAGGPCSFDAEMTLAEYEKGALRFDY